MGADNYRRPGAENFQRKKAKDHLADDVHSVEDDNEQEAPEHPLDSIEAKERLRKLEEFWVQARMAHSANRREMALDEAFRDGDQWSSKDKSELEERGQHPLVFNLLLPMIMWVCGTERKTRVDSRVLPRGKEDQEGAECKTSLLKYISDVNKEQYARSEAFKDAATVGVGWIEDGVRDDETVETIFSRHESWRNIWTDHLCREQDIATKGRYIFRVKWVDLDFAIAMFPDREVELKAAAEQYNSYQPFDYDELDRSDEDGGFFEPGFDSSNVEMRRPRVRLIECWYREPGRVNVLRGVSRAGKRAPFNGSVYNEDDPVLKWAVDSNHCQLVELPRAVVRVAIFVPGTLLQECKSPYWHNRFPFTPIWCFRKGKDGMPFGLIRGSRPIQEDLNKRRSKALHVLSNNQVLMEAGAVDNKETLRDEVDRPDGIIEYRHGKKLEIDKDNSLAAEHISLMQEDRAYIQESVGITSENLGLETNAVSGKAIIARQQQGHTIASSLFDSLRFAIQNSGERKLALVEQFYDQEKVIRLVGERGKVDFIDINAGGSGNIITETQADFVVDEEDYNSTTRQAMFQTMLEMVSKLDPSIGVKLLDMVFDMSDIPGREEIVRRMREINGQKDPAHKQTEEEIAAEQKAVAEERELMMRKILAELETLEGKATEAKARGDKATLDLISGKLQSMSVSLGIASQIATLPPVVGYAADAILTDAKTGNGPALNPVIPRAIGGTVEGDDEGQGLGNQPPGGG